MFSLRVCQQRGWAQERGCEFQAVNGRTFRSFAAGASRAQVGRVRSGIGAAPGCSDVLIILALRRR